MPVTLIHGTETIAPDEFIARVARVTAALHALGVGQDSVVAVMLELARILKEQKPNIGVILLCVDGEDYGDFSQTTIS